MFAKFIDLRKQRDVAQAKELVAAWALLYDIHVDKDVSRDGLMLTGDEATILNFLVLLPEILRKASLPAKNYDPAQQPFDDGDI